MTSAFCFPLKRIGSASRQQIAGTDRTTMSNAQNNDSWVDTFWEGNEEAEQMNDYRIRHALAYDVGIHDTHVSDVYGFNEDEPTHVPLYLYLGQITLEGFPSANVYSYRTESGLLRVEVQGKYYPFDFDGDNTLEFSMYIMACNFHRCKFAEANTGQMYDESSLPGKNLEVTSFQYMASADDATLTLHRSESDIREQVKTKTWRDIIVEEGLQGLDIEFRYV